MLKAFTELLLKNPLVLLFLVAAIGYPLGQIKIRGISLGVAAVLFVGIGIGALHPDFKLPEIIYQLGLVLFVYTIGLSSGQVFFSSLRKQGLRNNGFVLGILITATLLTYLLFELFHLKPLLAAGMFAGSLTTTPALASVLDYIKDTAPKELLDQMLAEPVVGYSITYPMGVVGMILAIVVLQRFWKVDYAQELKTVRDVQVVSDRLYNRTILVTQTTELHKSIHELLSEHGWDLVFGRLKHQGHLSLATGEKHLEVGDLVSVIGKREDVAKAETMLGEASQEHLELDRSEFDYRRIFVSNPKVAGHCLKDLNLQQQFGAVVTRIRRGDVEWVAHDDTILELGDRVRVVTKRDHMDAVTKFFGDSYRATSEVDVLTFSFGLVLGLLLGSLPLPLPGGLSIKLGLAGGPLVMALILGAVERTGSLVWNPPYSTNMVLRQIGLVFFLAGVGTRAGYVFVQTLTHGGGMLLVLGTVITSITAILALWIGYRLLKIPMGLLLGMLAGMQTQPAILGFALAQTENDLPNIGYASVYPAASIIKIILIQILLTVLI